MCRWSLLNNQILTFHYLFIFTESIDKQQPLFTINYYMCMGERDIVNCLLIWKISYMYIYVLFRTQLYSLLNIQCIMIR